MYPKGIFDRIKIKWILGGFVVTLGLRNVYMGDEVKRTFLNKYNSPPTPRDNTPRLWSSGTANLPF